MDGFDKCFYWLGWIMFFVLIVVIPLGHLTNVLNRIYVIETGLHELYAWQNIPIMHRVIMQQLAREATFNFLSEFWWVFLTFGIIYFTIAYLIYRWLS